MDGGRKIIAVANMPDNTDVLTARPFTQLKGGIPGAVIKRSNTTLAPYTLAADEAVVGPSWTDMRVGAALRGQGVAAAALAQWAGTNVWLYKFDVGKELYFTTQLDHKWRAGTALHPHVHWTTDDTTAAASGKKVTWQVDYTVAAPSLQPAGVAPADSLFAAAVSTISGTYTFPDNNERQYGHWLTEMDNPGETIAMSSWLVPSTVIMGRLSRVASGGTDFDDVFLVEFDFHYEVDGLGSDKELTEDY